ncbi:hypothetical protein MG296_11885 [Flavobacteriaceae bacterium TK19130]|nr:hypothetical protein [Thermobacterium salinum]
MKTDESKWTKTELKAYILLLCAKADAIEKEEEIDLIKSKFDSKTFDKVYRDFCQDDEEACLEKIETAIENHEYSESELSQLKNEVYAVFRSDKLLSAKEQNIARILDNILY